MSEDNQSNNSEQTENRIRLIDYTKDNAEKIGIFSAITSLPLATISYLKAGTFFPPLITNFTFFVAPFMCFFTISNHLENKYFPKDITVNNKSDIPTNFLINSPNSAYLYTGAGTGGLFLSLAKGVKRLPIGLLAGGLFGLGYKVSSDYLYKKTRSTWIAYRKYLTINSPYRTIEKPEVKFEKRKVVTLDLFGTKKKNDKNDEEK